MYVLVGKMGPPTLKSCTRCELGFDDCGGAEPLEKAKLQVLPACPLGKGKAMRVLVSC